LQFGEVGSRDLTLFAESSKMEQIRKMDQGIKQIRKMDQGLKEIRKMDQGLKKVLVCIDQGLLLALSRSGAFQISNESLELFFEFQRPLALIIFAQISPSWG
jgi:hypothetical protein